MDAKKKQQQRLPVSDQKVIEERLKLNVYEYLDERVAKKFKNLMWMGVLIIAVCAAFISVFGYTHISAFLAESLEKQVDNYFATRGGDRLKENLGQMESMIAESQRTLDSLKLQDESLRKLEALKKLQVLESESSAMKETLIALGYGLLHVKKGQEFQLTSGPIVVAYKVRDIRMDEKRLVVVLGGDMRDRSIVTTYVLDKDGRPVFEKKINELSPPLFGQRLEAVIVEGNKSSVLMAVRVSPFLPLGKYFLEEEIQVQHAPSGVSEPTPVTGP